MPAQFPPRIHHDGHSTRWATVPTYGWCKCGLKLPTLTKTLWGRRYYASTGARLIRAYCWEKVWERLCTFQMCVCLSVTTRLVWWCRSFMTFRFEFQLAILKTWNIFYCKQWHQEVSHLCSRWALPSRAADCFADGSRLSRWRNDCTLRFLCLHYS